MKKALADALEDRGYTTLTPVQQAVTNPDLTGVDLLVSAQTGSGKTLGFGLAIAPVLLGEAEQFDAAAAPLALIIAPTRELAMQVNRELSWLYAKAGAVVTSCVGGMDMRDERRALARGAHIVVATPGRLRDHIMRGSIELGELRAVVLDEADEMLDLGFREDLEFILGEAPDDRQTLLFSATVPKAIATLAKSYQKDAQRIETKSAEAQHADIEYRAFNVSERDAENAIINTLRFYEAPNAIVFCNTRAMVNRLTTRLSNRGFAVVALSGELSQAERTHALQAMRDGRARVCVATDVAARGIDLPNLDLVVHAELPSSHETLLHRSGRTGRAGRKGVSSLIVTPKSRKKAERILHFAKLKAEWSEAPSAEAVMARDEERMLADSAWQDAITESEADGVAKLMDHFAPEQIAAAYLRLYHARHSAPEELMGVDAKPAPKVAFGPSVWFSVAGGRNAGAEPRRLLPMLCKIGGITKDDIGAIRIQADESYVELRESAVAAFLDGVGSSMKVEGGAAVTRMSGPPADTRGPRPAGGKTYAGKGDKDRADRPKPAPRKYDGDKPAPRAPKADRPKYDPDAVQAPAPRPTPKGTTKPVEWNDAPAPKPKKPKAADKPKPADKPKAAGEGFRDASFRDPSKSMRTKSKPGAGKPRSKLGAAIDDGAVSPAGGKRKPGAKFARPEPGKGPRPPVGKPNSKKNKARAADGGRPRGKPGHGGGNAPPRRGKP